MLAGLSMQRRKGVQLVLIGLNFDTSIRSSEFLNKSGGIVTESTLRQHIVVLIGRIT